MGGGSGVTSPLDAIPDLNELFTQRRAAAWAAAPLAEEEVPPTNPPGGPVVVGCHGGAGATTVAGLLDPPGRDEGVPRSWSLTLAGYGARVVLVTRGTVAGADAAGRMVTMARSMVPPLALVVVSDGLPEPPAARALFRLLAARVGQVVRLPYVGRWRYLAAPPLPREVAALPRELRRPVSLLRALAGEAH